MYAGTKFIWHDNSQIFPDAAAAAEENRPLLLTAFSSPKGTEKMVRFKGEDFYKMYGKFSTYSFEKHGQPLFQAAFAIDEGAELLCKRVVANDATLSNVILVAHVSSQEVTSTDADGNTLYIDAVTGNETTSATSTDASGATVNNTPITSNQVAVKWSAESISNCKTSEEVEAAAKKLFDDANGVYPLIVVSDVGRNKDCKAIRITPDYETSKSLGFMTYSMRDIEGTDVMERVSATCNPYIIWNGNSYAITKNSMGELYTDMPEDIYKAYVAKLATELGMEEKEFETLDIFFGCTLDGVAINNLSIDADGIDLSSQYGVPLANGSDGTTFGTSEYFKSDDYAQQIVAFFDGEFTDKIYDVDVHKIFGIVDANYPQIVKNAIAAFVDFREDCFFFRDLGLGNNTFAAIRAAVDKQTKSRFAANYMTTYDVINPNTKKHINVTCMWDLAKRVVDDYFAGAYTPFAGSINGVILDSAIEGTLNYQPVITPTVDQKKLLDDLRVNYATYFEYGGDLTMASTYTSQAPYTQLSYLNNVLAVQTVMRALRTECPKNRFRFVTGSDFTIYKDACNEVLKSFKDWFYSIELVYTQDDLKAAQKIFYASINFSFNNFGQSEIFDLYALPIASVSTS